MVARYGVKAIVALAVTLLIWSTTFAAQRAGLAYFDPGHLVLLRWGAAALLLLAYGSVTGMRAPARRDLPAVFLAGALGFGVYQIALAYGQTGISAGTAGLLINLSPVSTLVIAALLRLETVSGRMWAGLAVSFAGLLMLGLARDGFGGSPAHAALVVFAAASFGGYVHVTKLLLRRYTPLEVTTYAICAGVLPFGVWAPGSVTAVVSAPLAGQLTLAYLALFPGAIAYVTWSRAIAVLPGSVAARGLYLVPVAGLAVAWAWLGEVPSAMAVVGGLVVIAGVVFASGSPSHSHLATVSPAPESESAHPVASAA